MKKLASILCLSIITMTLTSLSAEASSKKEKVRKTTCYSIDLDCTECQKKIETAIPFEKGVKWVTVNIEKDIVSVTYDPKKNDDEKLKAAFEELDFKVISYKEIIESDKK